MRSLVLALVMAFLPLVPAQAQNYVGLSWGLMSYDDGDESLDSTLAGIIPVITGYQDKVYYPIL